MKVQSVSLAGVELGGGHKGRKEAICFGVPASVSIWHRSVNHPPCGTDQRSPLRIPSPLPPHHDHGSVRGSHGRAPTARTAPETWYPSGRTMAI